jgi:hypothetical protein
MGMSFFLFAKPVFFEWLGAGTAGLLNFLFKSGPGDFL